MKYTAILNGKEREIELTQLNENLYRVTIDGKDHEVDARYCASDWLNMLWNNESCDISFTQEDDTVELNFWNQQFEIEVLDERKMRMRKVRTALDLSGPELIQTSMPGKVVKILVKEGQRVKAGTGIIIIEAMKMENEIKCRNDGKIKHIRVKPGQAVEAAVPLIEIEQL